MSKEEAAKSALEFLESQTVGFLATVAADGMPSVSPVYFFPLKDFSIYFSTSHSTQKFNNLNLNHKVAFSVGTGSGADYRVVSIHGTAKSTDENERVQGLALIASHVKTPIDMWPIKKVKLFEERGIALFKITPEEVTFLNISAQDQPPSESSAYTKVFP